MKQRTIHAAFALILASLAAGACYAAAGATLGLFIGGLAFAAILVPTLIAASSDWGECAMIAAGVWIGMSIFWIAGASRPLSFNVVLQSAIVLAAFIAAVGAMTRLMSHLVDKHLASTIISLIAIAWLSWPIWLTAHPLSDRAVARLVIAHPIFAINGISPMLSVWTQSPLMYRLTSLGQDVPYSLPENIGPCAIAHALIALAAMALLSIPRRIFPTDEPRFDR